MPGPQDLEIKAAAVSYVLALAEVRVGVVESLGHLSSRGAVA